MESQGFQIRDFTLSDLERVKEIHEASEIDYRFPDLAGPLFIVRKVLEKDGRVEACGGGYIQSEAYLWISRDQWATPAEKLAAIQALDEAVLHDLWLNGVDCCCLRLPPGMERFGERLEELGWTRDREWATFSKQTG